MPDPVKQQTQQHQPAQPVFQVEQQQQLDIRQELTRLQTWELAPDQTLEEAREDHIQILIQRQQEDNVALLARAQAQMPQAQVRAAAPGQPVQQQAPAKKTYKQKREEAKKTKLAKKQSPYADHVSYDIQHQLDKQETGRGNSITPEVRRRAVAQGVDLRVLRSFCTGYQKNKKGAPASPEDDQRMQADQAFLEDYLSKDVTRRTPHLQRFTDELLEVNITADLYTPESIHQNAAWLKRIADRMTYYENMQKDPVNAPFFQNMDPMRQALLKEKLDLLAPICSMLTVSQMGAMAVNCDKAAYYTEPEYIRNSVQLRNGQLPLLEVQLAEYRRREQAIIARSVEALADQEEAQLLQDNQEMKQAYETEEDKAGLGLTAYTTGYSFDELAKYRGMIEANPEAYAQNKQAIDRLYQGLHHAMDVMGELNGRIMAYQQVCDSRHTRRDRVNRLLSSRAIQEQERLMGQVDQVRNQFAAMADSLRFYLRGAEISAPASLVLEREGLQNQAKTLYAHRQAEKAISGPGGSVEASNAALRLAREQGLGPRETESAAFQALGLRTSNTAAAKADALVRGTTYIGLPREIALYFTQTEAANVDYAQVEQNMKKTTLEGTACAFVSGGGVDQVNAALLARYTRYVTSPESIAYLRYMTQALSGAEIFGGDTGRMVWFLSQALINNYGANFTEVAARKDSYRNGDAVRMVAREACRTMLTLPALTRLSEEQRGQLPEATRQLLAQYEGLLRTLTGMVLGQNTGIDPTPSAPDAPDAPDAPAR